MHIFVNPPQTFDDNQLVAQMQAGSHSAFTEIVKRYQKMVHRLALRYVKSSESADDISQEAFIKVYQKIHFFKGVSSFKSWLYRIVINTSKNWLRAQSLRETSDINSMMIADESNNQEEAELEQTNKIVQLQINRLAPKQRQAVLLRVYNDLSFKEIADQMACPFDTAKANYRHGLLNMRKAVLTSQELCNELGREDTDMDRDYFQEAA